MELSKIEELSAVTKYKEGDHKLLVEILRSEKPISASFRTFLGDIIEGKIKRKKGRPTNHNRKLEVMAPVIRHEVEVLTKWYERRNKRLRKSAIEEKNKHRKAKSEPIETPINRAIRVVAERWGSTEHQIDHIYYPRNKDK